MHGCGERVSPATLSAGSAIASSTIAVNRPVPERPGPLPGPFDQGVEVPIGKGLERAVDLVEAWIELP